MPPALIWLPTVIRVAIAPVLLGALALVVESPRSVSDLGAAAGLGVLSAIHVVFWWRPWPTQAGWAVAAVAGMVVTNFVLLNLLGLAEPLVWLYPALIAGAGLRAPMAVIGIGLTALAAAAPIAFEGGLVHPFDPVHAVAALGPSHSVLLSIVLAGLGMIAVRQLIALNADLHATRAELADLAVAADRERLAGELHGLLGRTLSLIAVKAELASRLSATSDPSVKIELADVQQLARQAVRDVREAVTGAYAPNVEAELAAAQGALRTAGIEVSVDSSSPSIDPAHESTIAWAVREAVTNVVKHSGARTCHIALDTADGSTTLDVEDDGRGPVEGPTGSGTGLDGLAERVHALGGTIEVGPNDGRGFRLRVRLGAPRLPHVAIAR
jgi:two-component system, NarL family, sensor histidine kinase DesK